jgi:hypothetical protein
MSQKQLRETRKMIAQFNVDYVETITGKGHVKFSFANGCKKASIFLSGSPSCSHSLANHKADVIRALRSIGLIQGETA